MIQEKAESLKRKSSLCMKKQTSNKPTFMESFKGYFTNMSYGLQGLKLGYFTKTDKNINNYNTHGKFYILGEQTSIKEAQNTHKDIIWFTYKKNISISSQIHSDVGWGCLIRVAQMILAHSIKKYFYLVQKQIQKNYIITPFLEEKGSEFKYNLYQFIEKGRKMWRINPGQWYSMTQIATILQELHNVTPLRGSQNLKVKTYNQTINLSQIMKMLQIPICQCERRKINCTKCQNNKASLKKSYFEKSLAKSQRQSNNYQFKKHLLLIITTKLGQKTIQKRNYQILLKIMSLPIFNGCLGGVPNKARFLTGRHQDKIIYLDPHYVETAVDQINLTKKLQIFQCKQIRQMSRQQLDPQIGLSFYISSQPDLQLLVQTIDKIKNQYGKLQFLRYDWSSQNQFQILADQEGKKQSKHLKQNFQDLQASFTDANSNSIESSFLME